MFSRSAFWILTNCFWKNWKIKGSPMALGCKKMFFGKIAKKSCTNEPIGGERGWIITPSVLDPMTGWLCTCLLKVIDNRRGHLARGGLYSCNSHNNTNGGVQLVSREVVGGRCLMGVRGGWGLGRWNLSTGNCWACWQILHSAVCNKRTTRD